MAGVRFAVYMLGIIVALLGLWLLLRAMGVTRAIGGDVALAVVILLLGLGIMAAAGMIMEPLFWGPRRRRYYEASRTSPTYREAPLRERVVREPVREPVGESRETVVEEE